MPALSQDLNLSLICHLLFVRLLPVLGPRKPFDLWIELLLFHFAKARGAGLAIGAHFREKMGFLMQEGDRMMDLVRQAAADQVKST